MRRNCRREIVQFASVDDPLVPIAVQDRVARALRSAYHRLAARNHFMDHEIPELLSAALAVLAAEAEPMPADDALDTACTEALLAAQLAALGVRRGAHVMVHSALSRVGFVAGGVRALASALFAAVHTNPTEGEPATEGEEALECGTVLVPTHSSDLTDPALWRNPPTAHAARVRDSLPAYDRDLTPTFRMGALADYIRKYVSLFFSLFFSFFLQKLFM